MLCFLPLHLEHLLSVLVFVLLDTNHVDIIFSISIALRKYPCSSGVNPEGTVEVAKGAVRSSGQNSRTQDSDMLRLCR